MARISNTAKVQNEQDEAARAAGNAELMRICTLTSTLEIAPDAAKSALRAVLVSTISHVALTKNVAPTTIYGEVDQKADTYRVDVPCADTTDIVRLTGEIHDSGPTEPQIQVTAGARFVSLDTRNLLMVSMKTVHSFTVVIIAAAREVTAN